MLDLSRLDLVAARVAIVHDWLTSRADRRRWCCAYSGCFRMPRSSPRSTTLRHGRGDHPVARCTSRSSTASRGRAASTHGSSPYERGVRVVRPLGVRPGDLQQPQLREERLTGPDTLHVCYCHTPMRHAWEPRFLEGERIGPAERLLARPMLARLRREDVIGSLRPDRVRRQLDVTWPVASGSTIDARPRHPSARRRRPPARSAACSERLLPVRRSPDAVQAAGSRGRRMRATRPARSRWSATVAGRRRRGHGGAVHRAARPSRTPRFEALMLGVRGRCSSRATRTSGSCRSRPRPRACR